MKTCFKCHTEKPITEFYKHPRMGDGHLGKCKTCTKKDVQERYDSPSGRTKIFAYEKARFKTPHRKEKLKSYVKKRRANNPVKCKAWAAVARALKNGNLIRLPCRICGDPKSQGHHHDYSKPLDVDWLCFKHHREIGHGQKVYQPTETT